MRARKAACRCCIRLAKRKRKVNDRTTSRLRRGTREEKRAFEWIDDDDDDDDDDAKITHAEEGEMGEERKRSNLGSDGMGGAGCLFVSRGRSRWHSSPAFSSSFRLFSFLRQIGSFSCVSHCFTLHLPSLPQGFIPPSFHSLPSPNGRQTVSC